MAQQQPEDPPTPWCKSRAKRQLEIDILSGVTKHMKSSTAVYKSRPTLYMKYKLANFQNNYRSLKKKIEQRQNAAARNRKAFDNDKPFLAQRRIGFQYNGSLLQSCLRRDVQAGRTDGKTPSQVRALRLIYQHKDVPLTKFKDHLSFERRVHQRNLSSDEYRLRMRFVNAQITIDD